MLSSVDVRTCVDGKVQMSLSSRVKQKFFKRKPKPWHLSTAEVEEIEKMTHDQLVDQNVRLKEQQNRIMRAMTKLKQAIVEMMASGE